MAVYGEDHRSSVTQITISRKTKRATREAARRDSTRKIYS
jgi:hypothetical protein